MSFEEAAQYAEDLGMVYVETSAKDSTNIEEAFMLIARALMDRIENGDIDPENEVW